MSVFKSLKELEHTVVENVVLFNNDCFNVFPQIGDKSVDMILCDLPYGTTACKWDTILPFDKLWEQYERIIKDNGAIVLTASQPFTSVLVASNLKMFKYDWVWEKSRPTGVLNAKRQPLRIKEDVLVFYKKKSVYNPQGLIKVNKYVGTGGTKSNKIGNATGKISQTESGKYLQEYGNYPNNIIRIKSEGKTIHPTQKPIALMEYLIKTYTNENELVLDNCFGSNTTGVACKNLNRKYIGIEMDKNYFDIGVNRLKNSAKK